ncbi:MAG: GNAT family N-acetyltransferase [Pseudomonadota bacterium]
MASASSTRWQLCPVSELGTHAAEWDALNAATLDSPAMDAEFFRIALSHFGSGDERLALARENGGLVAATLLEKTRSVAWQSFQAAQAPMGAWLQTTGAATEELLRGLQSALGPTCLVLGVTQQDPEWLPRPASHGGLRTDDYIRTARVTVNGSFDDYWSARGKNLRQNLRRQRNRLARESVETRMEAVSDAGAVGAAVDDYGHLESSGWKGGEGTSVHPDNAQGRFYRELFETRCAQGEGVVYRYFYNDQLVASDLCIHRNGILYLLKTAYSETEKTSSPTMLMREEMFRDFFDGGQMRRIEFYGRVMNWHTKWSDEIRTLYHISHYRPALLARLRGNSTETSDAGEGAAAT